MMTSTDEMFELEDQEKRKKIHNIFSILNKDKVYIYNLFMLILIKYYHRLT